MAKVHKTQFSEFEANEIRNILQKLSDASLSDKKQLRGILRRKYDFHISFFDNTFRGFNKSKFDTLIKSGVIIINKSITNKSRSAIISSHTIHIYFCFY